MIIAEGTGIEPEAIIGSKQLSRLPPSPSGFTFHELWERWESNPQKELPLQSLNLLRLNHLRHVPVRVVPLRFELRLHPYQGCSLTD